MQRLLSSQVLSKADNLVESCIESAMSAEFPVWAAQTYQVYQVNDESDENRSR